MTTAPRASLATLGLLLPLLKPYWLRVIAAIAALLLAAGLTLALGQGLKHLIDDGFAGGPGALDRAALVMGALVSALAITTTTRFYLVSWLGERVAADLRQRFFDHVTGLSPSYFETARIGDVMSRLTADVGLLQSLIGSAISMGVRQAITGIGAFVMLVLTSPKLAALIALILPMVLLPLIFFGRREMRLSK
ncbi:MAG: ABC transporter, partial [Roseomonas sp.]|nr:ABC transporter [Roseomonas sp.]